jgi:cell division transport system permease protein
LKRFDGMMEIGKRSVFVLAWLLAVAVLLIVGNTIRLSIQNRSEEIEVMQLVGATDAFIRRPFLYSGLWFGLLGGTIAWVLVSFSVWSLQKPVQHLANLYYSHFQLQTLDLSTSLWLLGLSTMLGLVGSWLAVSRHLHAIDS